EILGMNEINRDVSDHLLGPIAQDGHRARADLNKTACGIRDHNEVLRFLEDTPSLLDFLVARLLRLLAFADVACGLGSSDDLSPRRSDRGDAERDLHFSAVLVPPH